MNEKVITDCMDTSIDWIVIFPIIKILLYMIHIALSQHRQEPAKVKTTDLMNAFIVSWLWARERSCSEPVLSTVESHCVKVTLYWKPASKHSDKACGPTGLEEMVYTDPVCSQVGFPSSGLLNSAQSLTEQCTLVEKRWIPPSYNLYFGVFLFSCTAVISTHVTLPSSMATWPVTPSSSNTMGSSRSDQVYSYTAFILQSLVVELEGCWWNELKGFKRSKMIIG